MWSLGCVMVELFTARPLFAGRDSVEQLYKIIEVLGPPPQHMLEQAVYFKKYFVRKNNNELAIRGVTNISISFLTSYSEQEKLNMNIHIDCD
jgi:dual specificity protein kinase YAK1